MKNITGIEKENKKKQCYCDEEKLAKIIKKIRTQTDGIMKIIKGE